MAELDDDAKRAEFNFLWRRVLTFVWVILHAAILILIVSKLLNPEALKTIALALIGSDVLMALFYMAGASAVDVGKIIQSIATIKFPFGKFLPVKQEPEVESPKEDAHDQ